MGNLSSTNNNPTDNYDNCIVCWDKIKRKHLITCIRCNVQMHNFCYEHFSKIKKYNVCVCPHCQRIGTLGQELWKKREGIFEKSVKNY